MGGFLRLAILSVLLPVILRAGAVIAPVENLQPPALKLTPNTMKFHFDDETVEQLDVAAPLNGVEPKIDSLDPLDNPDTSITPAPPPDPDGRVVFGPPPPSWYNPNRTTNLFWCPDDVYSALKNGPPDDMAYTNFYTVFQVTSGSSLGDENSVQFYSYDRQSWDTTAEPVAIFDPDYPQFLRITIPTSLNTVCNPNARALIRVLSTRGSTTTSYCALLKVDTGGCSTFIGNGAEGESHLQAPQRITNPAVAAPAETGIGCSLGSKISGNFISFSILFFASFVFLIRRRSKENR